MLNVNDLRSGTTFQEEGNVFEVIDYSHTKMGRGTATIRVKVKNLKSGATTEKTFISGARVEEADLDKIEGQFLYKDSSSATFMDPTSFDQFSVSVSVLAGGEKYLREGENYSLLAFDGAVLKADLPRTVVLKVVETPPGVRGDTVSNVYKAALLENDIEVKVPLFINEGDSVKVDTRSGEYIERAKSS
ncbi:MAG TPA: elongation factor P [Candidatus Saccharimonadales bacterium]|nr:elongation factor P [Candidatus Saccharimonadales bacterium]